MERCHVTELDVAQTLSVSFGSSRFLKFTSVQYQTRFQTFDKYGDADVGLTRLKVEPSEKIA